MPPSVYDDSRFTAFHAAIEQLDTVGLPHWRAAATASLETLRDDQHGDLAKWRQAVLTLPRVSADVRIGGDAVSIEQTTDTPCDQQQIRDALMRLHPWRKGPWEYFGVRVDCEWRSDLKWQRITDHADWTDKRVLDVGCGNGYFGYRILEAGASHVVGIDPHPLFNMQFAAAVQYDRQPRNVLLPLPDTQLPPSGQFDICLSMGNLYHRTSPIDHLRLLHSQLRPGGTLVLETIINRGDGETVLCPADRYLRMRNVWFIPSVAMALRWLGRCGYRNARCVWEGATTSDEQRSTDWMQFESLADSLDPADASLTAEGYAAPWRAVFIAETS